MSNGARRTSWSWVADLAIALLITTGYGAPVGLAVATALVALDSVVHGGAGSSFGALLHGGVSFFGTLLTGVAFFAWAGGTLSLYRRIRDRGRGPFLAPLHALVLLLLPAWGLALNSFMLNRACVTTRCDTGPEMFRVLGERGLAGLVALHLLTALAFVVSRRRPAKLRPVAEVVVHALLVLGVGLHLLLAAQFADLLWGVVIFPVALPVVAPLVTIALYAHELAARLRRRGVDALAAPSGSPDAVYRPGPARVPATDDAPAHRPTLLAALATAPALAGAYAVVMAAARHRPAAALEVFTDTCGHALSRLPIQHLPQDCHYLCTVAARGTPSLVRPERLGRRGGQPVLVNRQLAVANAFEDLLHTRWPRFGRLARAAYDRLGLPVSRYITRPWMADAVFLAMKPLEWCFYATLLVLDRGDPEARIDRMYR